MYNMPELNLTQTALIIRGESELAKDVILSPRNRHYLVYSGVNVSFGNQSADIDPESRECTPAISPAAPELHLRFDSDMKDPSQGWVFGIDSAERKICDVILGRRDEVRSSGRKLSTKHFRIYFNFESGLLVLENESQHGTMLQLQGEDRQDLLKGRASRSLNAAKVIRVAVADLKFLLYYPTLDGIERYQHQANWQAFLQKCKTAIPQLGQLTLSSTASTRPPSHRTGLRNGYMMFEEIGRGEFGVVRRATQYRSGDIYAVKEYFRVKQTQEAKNLSEISTLQSLSHVSVSPADHAYQTSG
jgi:hypothetical protein